MQSLNKISRKDFLRFAWMIVAAPFIFLWGMSVKRYSETKEISILRISDDMPEGVSFYKEVIISKQGGNIKAFSSHCTHLGCVINEMKNGLMVCPCHGSKFDIEGKPVKGPAVEGLKRLNFETEDGEIIIQL